jgi:hypothetical protein
MFVAFTRMPAPGSEKNPADMVTIAVAPSGVSFTS